MSSYKKEFIGKILETVSKGNTNLSRIMKCSIMGAVTGVFQMSSKLIYTVDDGTGLLKCILWNRDSLTEHRLRNFLNNFDDEECGLSPDTNAADNILLSKAQTGIDGVTFEHGDIICCIGTIIVIRGEVFLDIKFHYKADDADAETLWNLEVLSSHMNE